MLKERDKSLLNLIIKRSNRILGKVNGLSLDEFISNDDYKEIICFNIFQIGELAHSLSNEFFIAHNLIPWKQTIGMRNKIVHGYDTIDYEIVYNTALVDIKHLKEYCETILQTK